MVDVKIEFHVMREFFKVSNLELLAGVVTCWGRAGAVPETMFRRCR
jgi:hypothetical protein